MTYGAALTLTTFFRHCAAETGLDDNEKTLETQNVLRSERPNMNED